MRSRRGGRRRRRWRSTLSAALWWWLQLDQLGLTLETLLEPELGRVDHHLLAAAVLDDQVLARSVVRRLGLALHLDDLLLSVLGLDDQLLGVRLGFSERELHQG